MRDWHLLPNSVILHSLGKWLAFHSAPFVVALLVETTIHVGQPQDPRWELAILLLPVADLVSPASEGRALGTASFGLALPL